eukprot:Phypoly_transcript_03306.p1 GENE.Phypoly_transcript_03306~~Phypoly_transcript_03306.p1  ORF type:complete len:590 (+),score=80.78 Phypoly_transcript_03306:71-1840(+)
MVEEQKRTPWEEIKHVVLDVQDGIKQLGPANSFKDACFFMKFSEQMKSPEGVQDREMVQAKLISVMAELHAEPDSPLLFDLERIFISALWDQLPHPNKGWASHCSAGPQFRTADGSQNNVLNPEIGKANSVYIRDVVSKNKNAHKLKDGSPLPDSKLIFEKLFKREQFIPHPCGLSSFTFHMATLITHDLFNSDYTAPERNKTTSYVDMSWLYGWNQAMQDSVRDKIRAKGKLYPDVVADCRLVLQPPGVVALALLWARNHNWIADYLSTNCMDDPRFTTIVDGAEGKSREEQVDELLFQTARAINIATYAYTIIHDYLRVLMGINRTNSSWTLDPTKIFEPDDVPSTTGNQCSIEFNFIYRWHSVISEKDEIWINRAMEALVGPSYTDPAVVIQKLTERREQKDNKKPYERTYFYETKRPTSPDGEILPYPDIVLARHLKSSIESPAGSFGGLNVPDALEGIEIMGIEQGRKLGVCTLNEYRKFLKLRRYTTFEEINPNPKISSALEELYKTVDDVELYPGIVAEQAMPKEPGVGLAGGFTIITAILSDAVALVRGLGFYLLFNFFTTRFYRVIFFQAKIWPSFTALG